VKKLHEQTAQILLVQIWSGPEKNQQDSLILSKVLQLSHLQADRQTKRYTPSHPYTKWQKKLMPFLIPLT
jgi:hypothetical protein